MELEYTITQREAIEKIKVSKSLNTMKYIHHYLKHLKRNQLFKNLIKTIKKYLTKVLFVLKDFRQYQ